MAYDASSQPKSPVGSSSPPLPPPRPREGLTLDTLYRAFRSTALNPLVTGPLLVCLLRYPAPTARFCRRLSGAPLLRLLLSWVPLGSSGLPHRLLRRVLPGGGIRVVKTLFACGLLRVANNWFGRRSVNNWVDDVYDWDKEIVVVTGGSGCIGGLVVRDLACRGITVLVLDLTPPREALPANVHFYALDVSDAEQIQQVGARIRAEHGDPTVLINSAAATTPAVAIVDKAAGALQRSWAVNVQAHFLLAREFVPALARRDHGHVVSVGSLAAFNAAVLLVDYCAAKAALVAFHEGLAAELRCLHAAPRVRTSLVLPGWIRSPLIAPLRRSPRFRQHLLRPETVADAIVARVLSGEGAQLVLPRRHALLSLLRGLPEWVGYAIRRHLAAHLIPPPQPPAAEGASS
ncbi:MAG: hypothetical protein M1818_001647 [Claussenomyces sp. TS43310]|nr:MAG: hypothetical protein M1818_001647 [Claussenomyces sp. TS43310]